MVPVLLLGCSLRVRVRCRNRSVSARRTAPIESSCINGDEYQVALTVTIGIGAGRIEAYPVSARAICGEG
jgi:hypothetical protein